MKNTRTDSLQLKKCHIHCTTTKQRGSCGRDHMPWYSRRIYNFLCNQCPDHGEVYSIQHYVIKFVNDLRQVGGFLWVPHFPLLQKIDKIKNQRLSRACIVHLVIKRTNWSYVKTMSCSGSHLGIPINTKNTKFVKDLPMIDFQLGPP